MKCIVACLKPGCSSTGTIRWVLRAAYRSVVLALRYSLSQFFHFIARK